MPLSVFYLNPSHSHAPTKRTVRRFDRPIPEHMKALVYVTVLRAQQGQKARATWEEELTVRTVQAKERIHSEEKKRRGVASANTCQTPPSRDFDLLKAPG